MRFNELLQWAGTAFILGMYVVSNFFKGYDDLRNGLALIGAVCFLVWAYRVTNKQQMIVNGVAIGVCVLGLWGLVI
jgi:hypothetical protein